MFFEKIASLFDYLDSNYELGNPLRNLIILGFIIISIAVPYMLGSINFGIVISKHKYREDIREHGSGNSGATNMLRTYGGGAAVMTMLGDMLKCAVAVTLGGIILNEIGASIAGLFCVMGHIFPCWHKFKGGKGVAATAVVALMLSPFTFAILLLVFLVILLSTKYVSLASIMGALLFPVFLNSIEGPGLHVLVAFFITILIVFMHRANIKRLLDKTESKISLKRNINKAENAEEKTDASRVPVKTETDIPNKKSIKNTSKKKLDKRR